MYIGRDCENLIMKYIYFLNFTNHKEKMQNCFKIIRNELWKCLMCNIHLTNGYICNTCWEFS